MSDQGQRILALEDRFQELEALRNQLIGMSTMAKWGYRLLIVLAGYGGLNAVMKVIAWLNAPIKVGH